MLQLLLIGAFIFFVVIAPFKVVVVVALSLLVQTLIVKFCTRLIAGHSPSLLDALKAILLSSFFAVLAFFGLASLMAGASTSQVTAYTGISLLAALGGFFASYVLGFSIALGIRFIPCIVIAVLSTIVSTVFLNIFKSLL